MKPGFPAAPAADPDIRQRMLAFVKARDRAFVGDVSRHFRVSHEGARKQLVRMEKDGWVERSPAQDGVGRPRDAYTVSAAGDHRLPKAYDKLAAALMDSLRGGPATLRDRIDALARAQVAAWRPKLDGKSLPEKLKALRELYADGDPFTSFELSEKEAVLIERNCPFLNVALEHPALCSLTVNTLEGLLGHPVVREERFQAGHGRCAFRILLDQKAPEAFSLEAERAAEAA